MKRACSALAIAAFLLAAPLFAEEGVPADGGRSALVAVAIDTSSLFRPSGPVNAFGSVGFQGSVEGFGVDAAVGISYMQYPDYSSAVTAWALAGFAAFFSGGVEGFYLSARGGMIYSLGASGPRNGVVFDAHVGWNFLYPFFGMDLMVGVAAGVAVIVPGGGAGAVVPSLLYSAGFAL